MLLVGEVFQHFSSDLISCCSCVVPLHPYTVSSAKVLGRGGLCCKALIGFGPSQVRGWVALFDCEKKTETITKI